MAKVKYSYLPLPDGVDSMTQIMLGDGPYEGVVYQYGQVTPTVRGDSLHIDFQYEVFKNPDKIDTESKQFRDVLFEILLEVIEKACAEK